MTKKISTWKANGGSFDHVRFDDEWRHGHQVNFIFWTLRTKFLMQGLHHSFDGKFACTIRHHVRTSSMSGNRAHADQRSLVLFHHGWQELSYHPHLSLNNPKEVLNFFLKKKRNKFRIFASKISFASFSTFYDSSSTECIKCEIGSFAYLHFFSCKNGYTVHCWIQGE